MIKAAVAGAGFIGKVHIEQLRRLGDVCVVAIADPSHADMVSDQLHIPKGYCDYREMILEEKPDVVHICTPNQTHYEIAMYAMEHGCHVVCEKPMAMSAEEGEKMLSFARERNLVCAVNLHNRFFPLVQQLREMVTNGELGRIHSLNGWYLQDWLLYESDFNWRTLSRFSGKTRAVADIGSHWMDTAEYVVGKRISEVFADFLCLYPQRKKGIHSDATFSSSTASAENYTLIDVDTEDHANILLRFEDGTVASLTVSQIMAGRKACLELNVGGTLASACWCSDTCNQLWIGKRSSGNLLLEKDPGLMTPGAAAYAGLPGGHGEGFADAMKNNFQAIYQAIRTSDAGGGYATFADGLHMLRVCDAIYESAHTGRWISVNEGKEHL